MSVVNSKDGTEIAYEQSGSGPALVIVDGALSTRRSESKAKLAELLSPGLTVYRYDRRGRGDSGDAQPYSLEREIEDIEALIGEAGGSAFLYGHSSGGCLALEAARALGAKVSKVAVYEAPYNDDPAAQKAFGEYIAELTVALRKGRRGDAVAAFLELAGTPTDQVNGMRQAPFWADLETIAHTLAYDHAAIMGSTGAVPVKRLAAVLTPALVMYGSASPAFMRITAETLAHVLPHAELRALDGQTHDVQPAVLTPILNEFFVARRMTQAA